MKWSGRNVSVTEKRERNAEGDRRMTKMRWKWNAERQKEREEEERIVLMIFGVEWKESKCSSEEGRQWRER